MPLADGATFAGYTILRLLGSGGMGEVYLAQHPRLPRRDALKILAASVSADSEYRARFNREADIAATLWHPHIVGVHDRGEFEGQIWISMDYVDGTDAARLLRERHPGGMPKQDVADIVTAVAEALDYAHQRNLLHRDVKPANILMAYPESGDQRILLADFGIARWADDVSGLTETNMTVGTVSYAAPEQLMGQELDGRADQYSLAATAFHLLTGSPPFTHSNPAVVISQHLSASPPNVGARRPELSGLDPVLAKALAKDPKDRYERCSDFAHALSHRLGVAASADVDLTRPAAAAAMLAKPRSLLRASVIVPVILAVLLVAAVTVALMEFHRAGRPAKPPARARTATAPRMTPPSVAPPVAVIGANCSPVGSTATTAEGATAYCSTLQNTGALIWSLTPGQVPSPTVSAAPTESIAPTEQPLPTVEEAPVRVCMQQTGRSLLQCREMIRRSNIGRP